MAANTQHPGGVGQPMVWLLGNENGETEAPAVLSRGRITPHLQDQPHGNSTLNYHPLWKATAAAIQADGQIESEATYFVVYQTAERSYEEGLWSVERDDTTRLLMTTRRFADMSKGVYADYPEGDGSGKLQSYIHQRKVSTPGSSILTLFDRPESTNLPVARPDRLISEFIMYDRALSDKERIQVESYLALKYGLTLRQPIHTIYLDSNGDIIWSDDRAGSFTERVTAVGRDDSGNFSNLQSQSVLNDNPVSIAFGTHAPTNSDNPAELANGTWLIWSDDNGLLAAADDIHSLTRLERRWRMEVLSAAGLSTQVSLDRDALVFDREYQHIWMEIDRGEGLPELFRGRADNGGEVVFDSVLWDTDGSGQDWFTFLSGGEIMPSIEVAHPVCGVSEKGTVHIKPYGGVYPYHLVIDGTRREELTVADSAPVSVFLEPGIHEVRITDAAGLTWTGALTISSEGMPEPCLLQQLTLPGQDALKLNAETLCLPAGVAIRLLREGSFLPENDSYVIDEPGKYQLVTEMNGCRAFRNFTVRPNRRGIFRSVDVFPNPVRAGKNLTYRIQLEDASDLELTIHDAAGRQVFLSRLGSNDFFRGALRAPVIPGTYTLRISSGRESSSHQFITID